MSRTSKPVSEIDRLIELASDEMPHAAVDAADTLPQHSLSLENQKDASPSMWRVLIQLRVLLPYLAKVLPLVERGLLGTNITGQSAAKIDTGNLERGIEGVGDAQRDLKTAVTAQAADLRLLQEQVALLTTSVEKNLLLSEETAASLSALRKLTATYVAVTIGLLIVIIGLLAFVIFGHHFGAS
jgi:hypothetical protein